MRLRVKINNNGSLYQPALFEHNRNSPTGNFKFGTNILENFECVSLWTVGRCRAVFFASFFFEKK
jgi:hypothetical protein